MIDEVLLKNIIAVHNRQTKAENEIRIQENESIHNKPVYDETEEGLLFKRVVSILENKTLKEEDVFALTHIPNCIEKVILDKYLAKNGNKDVLFNVILFLQKHAKYPTVWLSSHSCDFFLFGDKKKNLLLANDIARLWLNSDLSIVNLQECFDKLFFIHNDQPDALMDLIELLLDSLLKNPSIWRVKNLDEMVSVPMERCSKDFPVRVQKARVVMEKVKLAAQKEMRSFLGAIG